MVPLVPFLQLLAAATFRPHSAWVVDARAELQRRYNYMTESLFMAVLLGAFCPGINRSAPAFLRFENATAQRSFDCRLARVLGCAQFALDPYSPEDTYPTELVQRFCAYNAHAPWLVAALTFLTEVTASSGHCLRARDRELFVLKFVYQTLRGALIFEVPFRQQPVLLD